MTSPAGWVPTGAMRSGILCAATLGVALLGCKKSSPLAAAYVGTVVETGRVQVDTSARDAAGRGTVQWWNTNRPRGNVRVAIAPAGERRVRIALPGCTVEAEMEPAPNDHAGALVLSPQPVCEIDIDHYRGPMMVGGNVQVNRETRALRIMISGNNNQLSPHVTWSLTYEARPE